jgi:hypothetical protein
MVQIDILGPFYLRNSSERNYFISCLDDCSRKVASKWCERKRTIDVLDVLEEWIIINGKPRKVMRDNGDSIPYMPFQLITVSSLHPRSLNAFLSITT